MTTNVLHLQEVGDFGDENLDKPEHADPSRPEY